MPKRDPGNDETYDAGTFMPSYIKSSKKKKLAEARERARLWAEQQRDRLKSKSSSKSKTPSTTSKVQGTTTISEKKSLASSAQTTPSKAQRRAEARAKALAWRISSEEKEKKQNAILAIPATTSSNTNEWKYGYHTSDNRSSPQAHIKPQVLSMNATKTQNDMFTPAKNNRYEEYHTMDDKEDYSVDPTEFMVDFSTGVRTPLVTNTPAVKSSFDPITEKNPLQISNDTKYQENIIHEALNQREFEHDESQHSKGAYYGTGVDKNVLSDDLKKAPAKIGRSYLRIVSTILFIATAITAGAAAYRMGHLDGLNQWEEIKLKLSSPMKYLPEEFVKVFQRNQSATNDMVKTKNQTHECDIVIECVSCGRSYCAEDILHPFHN